MSHIYLIRHGQAGTWVSELLPWTSKMVDEMCFIRSMHTEAINHEPAITYMQTGNQISGRPCLGSWASYGLGSLNKDLPTFVVLVARPTQNDQNQAIGARLWSSGYLSGEHAGLPRAGQGCLGRETFRRNSQRHCIRGAGRHRGSSWATPG
mgnify:CR=1 FL=1